MLLSHSSELLRWLLLFDIEGFHTSTTTFTPIRLHFAINNNNIDSVQKLIDQGLDLNFYAFGNTPLMLSLLRESLDIAYALIVAGASIEIGEKFKWQRKPIHLAARIGDLKLVKEMVSRCPKCVHSVDAMLFTPLHWAAMKGLLEVVHYLVESGAHLNVRDDQGRTPLHRAADSDRLDMVCLLIKEGALVNLQDNFGWTPLYQSIVCAQLDMVNQLLDFGANVFVRDIYGMTPLHVACGRKVPRNLKVMQKTSTDFYTRGFRSATDAVQKAVSICESDLPLVEILLDFGADVNAIGGDGRTPLRIAADAGNKEIIRLLVSACANLSLESWISVGEWPEKIADDGEFCAWLREVSSSRIFSLMQLCKAVIRRAVTRNNAGRKIHEKVVKLPLPSALKQFLFVSL